MCECERFEDRRHRARTTFILSSRTGNDRESYKGTSSPRGRKIYRRTKRAHSSTRSSGSPTKALP